jgi:hypothetical protein
MKTKKLLGWWALVIAAASVSFIWLAGCPAEGQVE